MSAKTSERIPRRTDADEDGDGVFMQEEAQSDEEQQEDPEGEPAQEELQSNGE